MMAFLQNLQQKLKDLYREFSENIEEINIQLKPEMFKITTVEQIIEVPIET
ncbi:739_t:CDS:1, partial [Diversispora eburnea]